MDGWDVAANCTPVCWVVGDGGWAASMWELWQTVSTRDGMTGAWVVDWTAFRVAVAQRVLEDDEERLDVMRGLRQIAARLNAPEEALFDEPEPEE